MEDIATMFRNSLQPDEESIQLIPSSVSAAYRKILHRVPSDKIADVRMILQIIVGARRPLTIEEMAMAIGVAKSKNSRTTRKAGLRPEGLDKKIRQLCGLFVFIKNSRVYLIHQTAREFLTSHDWHSDGREWSFRLEDTETLLSQICINYLLLDEMDDPSQNSDGQGQVRPMYEYASTYWGQHARMATLNTNLVSELLSTKSEICSKCLLWSVKQGDEETVRWLAERGINTNVHDESWRTPLHAAVLNGWKTCVKSLLRCGAVMSTDIDNMTPFHYAALAETEAMVQLFLDAKIPIDTRAKRRAWLSEYQQDRLTYIRQDRPPHSSWDLDLTKGLTVLHYAALAGHADSCKLFLGHGADPKAKSEYGETPLHLALKKDLHGLEWPSYTDHWNDPAGKIEYATALIGYGPGDDDEYSNTVSEIEKERMDIITLLLGHPSTDVNAQDDYGTSPLHCVAYGESSSAEIVAILSERNAKTSLRNHDGQTALHLACKKGDIAAMAALLKRGAASDDVDINGLNALHYVAQSGNDESVRYLCDQLSDRMFTTLITSVDKRGQNALHHLLGKNVYVDTATITYFLTNNVCVNGLDENKMSPLEEYLGQSWPGDSGVVQFLLDNAADPSLLSAESLRSLHKLGVAWQE